jgi:hypothetical protein
MPAFAGMTKVGLFRVSEQHAGCGLPHLSLLSALSSVRQTTPYAFKRIAGTEKQFAFVCGSIDI